MNVSKITGVTNVFLFSPAFSIKKKGNGRQTNCFEKVWIGERVEFQKQHFGFYCTRQAVVCKSNLTCPGMLQYDENFISSVKKTSIQPTHLVSLHVYTRGRKENGICKYDLHFLSTVFVFLFLFAINSIFRIYAI